MSEEHRVLNWKKWINSFTQSVDISIQHMQTEISMAKYDIEDWDSITENLQQLDREITLLYSQLSSCQTDLGSSPAAQNAILRKREAIQSEISVKAAEKRDLQVRQQSTAEKMRQWQKLFRNENYYKDLFLKQQESEHERTEMIQYQKLVRQADATITNVTEPFGTLSGNKYGSFLGRSTTVMKDQISTLTTMQNTLLEAEKRILSCCRTAMSLLNEIANRIDYFDPQTEYGQKRI